MTQPANKRLVTEATLPGLIAAVGGINSAVAAALAAKADLVSGKATVAQTVAGNVLAVHYTGAAWPARPTARTDVTVHYYALTNADPAPTDFVAGVDYLFKPT